MPLKDNKRVLRRARSQRLKSKPASRLTTYNKRSTNKNKLKAPTDQKTDEEDVKQKPDRSMERHICEICGKQCKTNSAYW
jgi:hypothetical protein